MAGKNILPVVRSCVTLEVKNFVEIVTVIKPQSVEISHAMPSRFKILFSCATDEAEALVKGVKTGETIGVSTADIPHLFPKQVTLSRHVFFNDFDDEASAIPCGHPFKRSVETGVKHEPVFHIVGEHIVVEHCRLTEHCPRLYFAVKHRSFTEDFL